jgi:hypothetical protein
MYNGEVFEGMRAPIQYMLSVDTGKEFEFDRSKVNPVWKFMGKIHRPLGPSENTRQPEVPTQRRRFIDDGGSIQIRLDPLVGCVSWTLKAQIFKVRKL